MEIQLLSKNEILIEQLRINLREKRRDIRMKLPWNYKENDQVIRIGEFNEEINQRRDIYQNIQSAENLFFLGYNDNSCLIEIEIHHCQKIRVLDSVFDFETDVTMIAFELSKYSKMTKLSEGEYFSKDLKIVVLDKTHIGGEGNTLGYLYFALDVSHLE